MARKHCPRAESLGFVVSTSMPSKDFVELVADVRWFTWCWVRCPSGKREVRMSVLKSSSFRKKPYHRPTCGLKSMDEVGALLRKEAADQEGAPTVARASGRSEGQVLLIEGYEGEPGFIRQTTHTMAGPLESLSILEAGGLVEMQIVDERGSAPPRTCLLLDLRHRGYGERGVLDSIREIPDLRGTVPLVILVSSVEQFECGRGINVSHCWQLRRGPSSAELVPALQSFLRLCDISQSVEGESLLSGTSANTK